ncbi:MAG: nitroreductase family protein [Desulfovibrio sp.]|jgi:nitroreductase|nr:nitroreductase family protein [Desulfovibrio sp.]
MDTLTAIHTRRSVRSYTPEPVSEEEIQTLLEAAMTAPSAGNAQPWTFLVITDPGLLARTPSVNPYAGMAAKAPLAILVCGDLTAEKYPGFWVQDCSAAIQNLLLAARSIGLGSVWTGIHPMEDRVAKAKDLFRLPDHLIPLGLIVIGRPKGEQQHANRFAPEKVRRNIWQD